MKNIIKILAVVIIFIFGVYFGYALKNNASARSAAINFLPASPAPANSSPAVNEGKIKVNLMLDFGDGKVKTFNNVEIAKEGTVFDLLKTAAAENSLALDFKDYGGDLGVMIKSIDGAGADATSGKYWQYWLNNSYAKVGAAAQKLAAGDLVEWKLIKGQF